jgi:hypothetical protein
VQCLNICVQNIVSSAYVGGTIDLLELYACLMKRGICDASYSPPLSDPVPLSPYKSVSQWVAVLFPPHAII